MNEQDNSATGAKVMNPADVSLDDLSPHNEYRDSTTRQILQRMRKSGQSVATQGYVLAGESLGATTHWLSNYVAVSSLNGKSLLFADNRAHETAVAGRLVSDKLLTKRLLENAGVSTPRGRIVENPDDAISFQRELGAAMVLKPRAAQKARGVSVNLTGPDEIRVAFDTAKRYGEVLAEAHIGNATEYRGFASPEACHGVIRRIPPWVEGDGEATISTLIDRRNATRQHNPATVNRPTPKDAQTIAYLEAQGLTLSTVLPKGRRVIVREVSSVSIGGEPWQCLETAPAEVREIAVAAAAALPGLSWGGVDIMVDENGKAYVLEINTNAAIGTVVYPLFGVPRPLNRIIYERRHENAPLTVVDEPTRITLHKQPITVTDAQRTEGRVVLSELLVDCHRDQGWTFEDVSRSLRVATSPAAEKIWLLQCASVFDLGIVYRIATRVTLARRMLTRAGIDQPRSRIVNPPSRLSRLYLRALRRPFVLARSRGMWGSHNLLVSSMAELNETLPKLKVKYLVQQHLTGTRMRVIATPTGPLAVTSSEPISAAQLPQGTDLATRAVRAIPELRWAAVDIVITKRGRALVEGLSLNPSFGPEDLLIAGSLDDVWPLILQS